MVPVMAPVVTPVVTPVVAPHSLSAIGMSHKFELPGMSVERPRGVKEPVLC